jgi:hypothetical protein
MISGLATMIYSYFVQRIVEKKQRILSADFILKMVCIAAMRH